MKVRRLAPIIAIIGLVAVFFIATGFAYTASTSNVDNNAVSEYVVLDQTDYVLTEEQVKVDAYTDSSGTSYVLKDAEAIANLGGKQYWGKLVGKDTIKATVTGAQMDDIPVRVLAFPAGFKDYSAYDDGWRYIIKIEGTVGGSTVTQYAVYDGRQIIGTVESVPWTIYNYQNGAWAESHDGCLELRKDVQYTTSLYFAGVYGDAKQTARYTVPPTTDGLKIINNGTIKFVYDSENESAGA